MEMSKEFASAGDHTHPGALNQVCCGNASATLHRRVHILGSNSSPAFLQKFSEFHRIAYVVLADPECWQ
jgi:hypothetical protein